MSIEAKPTVQKAVRPTQKTVAHRAATRKRVQTGHKKAPQKLKLLITIVPRPKTEYFMDLIQSFDVNMQFCTTARGTATSDIRALMGLEDSEKRVIFSVVREDMAPKVLKTLEEKFATIKNAKGIAMTVPLSGMIGVAIYQFLANHRKGGKQHEI
ncbi:MAG: hypothetical protein IKC75_06945 [Clostridia bacterium]|nr:hypothetical protein [Clostridia bacterium]